jgi:broad specificity phosphatase PhoE
MSKLRRLVLIRHGETDGHSSVRFHGSTDVPLSDEGRAQMRDASRRLEREFFDLVVASPLQRAWESARILAAGAPVRLDSDLSEIDFGRWEGLTKEEIEARDPLLCREWQQKAAGFEFPGGEPRADFRKRVLRALERLEQSGAASVLVVCHKGPIRTIAENLVGAPLEDGEPQLSGSVGLSQRADGSWILGRRSSDPEGVVR